MLFSYGAASGTHDVERLLLDFESPIVERGIKNLVLISHFMQSHFRLVKCTRYDSPILVFAYCLLLPDDCYFFIAH
jgi:hypothetical protein